MPTFRYEAIDEGKVTGGRLEADDQDEVVAKLKRMGMDPLRVGEGDGPMADVGPPGREPPSREDVLSFGGEEHEDEAEGVGGDSGLFRGGDDDDDPDPDTFGASPGAPAPVGNAVPPPVDDPPPPPPGTVSVEMERRESFLYGEYDSISARINDLLANRYGIVRHVALNPDMKGSIILAVVIEHDVPAGAGK
jgi:hypothetical protein